jgi:hypothetical protein
MEIPVSIHIDSEPDTYSTTNNPQTENFGSESLRLCFEVWNTFRQNQENQTNRPVHFNWLFRIDPGMDALGEPLEQVVKRSRKYFDNLLSQGDQFGLHFHPYFWNAEKFSWVAELDNKEWLSKEIRRAVARFKKVFGFSPESIRLSDNACISNWTLNLLEELGIKVDISLHRYNPAVFIKMPINGSVNSDTFLNLPDYPYQPDPEDFTKVGEAHRRNIVLIPTSVGSRLLPERDPTIDSGYRLERQHIALDMAYDNDAFKEALDERLRTLQQPHLVIVHNSNVLTDAKFTRFFYENLKTLSEHPLAKHFSFYTPTELVQKVDYWTAQEFNSYRSEYVNWLKSVASNKTDEYMQLRFNYMLLDNYKERIEKDWAEKAKEVEELKTRAVFTFAIPGQGSNG